MGEMKYYNPEIFEDVELHFLIGNPVMLAGPPGCGKTFLAICLAHKHQHELVILTGKETMTDSDMLGTWVITPTGAEWRDGPLSQAFRKAKDGKKVLLVIDEITRFPSEYQNIFIEMLNDSNNYGRNFWVLRNHILAEEIAVPRENLKVIATCNINQVGTYSIPEALRDRFPCHFMVNYPSKANEIEILKSKGLSHDISVLLVTYATLLREMHRRGELPQPLSTRALVHIAESFNKISKLQPNRHPLLLLKKIVGTTLNNLIMYDESESYAELHQRLMTIFEHTMREILSRSSTRDYIEENREESRRESRKNRDEYAEGYIKRSETGSSEDVNKNKKENRSEDSRGSGRSPKGGGTKPRIISI